MPRKCTVLIIFNKNFQKKNSGEPQTHPRVGGDTPSPHRSPSWPSFTRSRLPPADFWTLAALCERLWSIHNQFCWRFGLYRRPLSEEAGTSSSDKGLWYAKCQQGNNNWLCFNEFLIRNNDNVYHEASLLADDDDVGLQQIIGARSVCTFRSYVVTSHIPKPFCTGCHYNAAKWTAKTHGWNFQRWVFKT